MELNDALRIPLAPSVVWADLQDLALLRASLDNCESLDRLVQGEYALSLTVPLGPLRARYVVRAHIAARVADDIAAPAAGADAFNGLLHRTINFKARADGIGSLRGQIEMTLNADLSAYAASDETPGSLIHYTVWAMSAGPLAELPTRQLENALRHLAEDFFVEFSAVVQARHGQGPNRARGSAARRQHVFLRPISLGAIARRARPPVPGNALSGRAASASHGLAPRESSPHTLPHWAWAAMIFVVALLLYVARWVSER